MSYHKTQRGTAEILFREAFERLKAGQPIILPKNSAVTQNNVAREAERDPSALKKDRYPTLVLEIQAFVQGQRERQIPLRARSDKRHRTERETIAALRKQNSELCSLLEGYRSHIIDLEDQVEQLKSGKIFPIR